MLPQNNRLNKAMAERIRNARKKQNMTQEEMTARMQTLGCDISRGTLAKVEAGVRNVYADELKAFRIILHIPYEVLLGEEELS